VSTTILKSNITFTITILSCTVKNVQTFYNALLEFHNFLLIHNLCFKVLPYFEKKITVFDSLIFVIQGNKLNLSLLCKQGARHRGRISFILLIFLSSNANSFDITIYILIYFALLPLYF
jgi:hypothetical protein